ncbi:hypothetical protein NX794_15855 [Streptomyces sp. LP11]|uniref:Uncharacterized protein n=1 Tax=Streptomyces pyxinicus TaxID=2970331 RepID=A0ABT2B2C9_9ACTN|nr:hypothetical protein [Streptomyces sp. LP11]MCS0602674.1 hypothetical protein [Streptomyces sp. LP11]
MSEDPHDGPDDASVSLELPVPPPFMFGCLECVTVMTTLAERLRVDTNCFVARAAVSRHIVAAHPEAIPPPHTHDCDQYRTPKNLPSHVTSSCPRPSPSCSGTSTDLAQRPGSSTIIRTQAIADELQGVNG